MKKKEYIVPCMEEYIVATQGMLASSTLDSGSGTTDVMPSTDPADIIGGEFGAPGLPSLNPMELLFK